MTAPVEIRATGDTLAVPVPRSFVDSYAALTHRPGFVHYTPPTADVPRLRLRCGELDLGEWYVDYIETHARYKHPTEYIAHLRRVEVIS